MLDELADYLPFGWQPSASTEVDRLYSLRVGGEGPRPGLRRFHLVYANAGRIARTMSLPDALEALDTDLELYVAEETTQRLFVHAGVVGWRGRAILRPGTSHSGKTSLAAAFVRAGATYYSDDFAPLDPQGCVYPYARPLALREDGDSRRRRVPAEALGGVAGTQPLPVGLVLVTQYKPRARWRPRPLTPGQGLLALLANTVPARRQPQQALATLGPVVSQAPVWKSSRGDADAVAQAVLNQIGDWNRVASPMAPHTHKED